MTSRPAHLRPSSWFLDARDIHAGRYKQADFSLGVGLAAVADLGRGVELHVGGGPEVVYRAAGGEGRRWVIEEGRRFLEVFHLRRERGSFAGGKAIVALTTHRFELSFEGSARSPRVIGPVAASPHPQ